jgi:hypothetical protein
MSKNIIITTLPNKKSSAEEWLQWYRTMKRTVGKQKAKAYWVKAWGLRGGKDSPANTSALRSAMQEEGISITATALANITDFGGDILDGIGNVFSVGKWVVLGAAVFILLPVGMLLVNIARKPEVVVKAAGTLAAAKTGGVR